MHSHRIWFLALASLLFSSYGADASTIERAHSLYEPGAPVGTFAAGSVTAAGDGKERLWFARDLDGDGSDDLVFERTDDAGKLTGLAARKGSSGDVLWTSARTGSAYDWSDLSGDGVEDFLGVESLPHEAIVDESALVVERTERGFAFVAIDGETGRDLWRLAVRGDRTRAEAFIPIPIWGTENLGVASSTNNVRYFGEVPDATGDGIDDLWISTYDIPARAYFAGGQCCSYLDTDANCFYSGADGSLISCHQDPNDPHSWVRPIEDVNGDGLGDVLRWTTSFSAWSVGGTEPIWQRQIPISGSNVRRYGVALTGPGAHDIVLAGGCSGPIVTYPCTETIVGVRGSDGQELWRRTVIWEYWAAWGDTDGDGGTDLTLFAPAAGGALRMESMSGATGGTLWSKIAFPKAPHQELIAVAIGDFDGDGAGDPFLWEYTSSNSISDRVVTYRGKDGMFLWRMFTADQLELPWLPGWDMNGNGTEDMLSLRPQPSGDLELRILEGSTLESVWTIPIEDPGESWELGAAVGRFSSLEPSVVTELENDEGQRLAEHGPDGQRWSRAL